MPSLVESAELKCRLKYSSLKLLVEVCLEKGGDKNPSTMDIRIVGNRIAEEDLIFRSTSIVAEGI